MNHRQVECVCKSQYMREQLRTNIATNAISSISFLVNVFQHQKPQWQSPNHYHPLHQKFFSGSYFHFICSPFLLFLLLKRYSHTTCSEYLPSISSPASNTPLCNVTPFTNVTQLRNIMLPILYVPPERLRLVQVPTIINYMYLHALAHM